MEEQRISSMPEEAPTKRESGWRAVGMALLFLAAYFLVQFAVSIPYFLALAIHIVTTQGAESAALLLQAVAAAATAQGERITGIIDAVSLGVFALMLKLMHRPVLKTAGLCRTPIARLLPLVPLGVALNVLLTSLVSLLPADVLEGYMEASNAVLAGGPGWLSVVIIVILAPLTEEVLFRGLIFGNLKKALSLWLAVVLSSAVFGLMHGQIVWMVYTAVLGAFFCVVRERFDTLWASVLLHMAFNAGSFLIMYMQNASVSVILTASGAVAVLCISYILNTVRPSDRTSGV